MDDQEMEHVPEPQGEQAGLIGHPPQPNQQVGGGNPEANEPIARGNDQQMRQGHSDIKMCPKYDRKIPWRQFVFEFRSWITTFEIERCGDEFIKNTLVWAMRGPAQDMINLHRQGTPTFRRNVTWRNYAAAIEQVFAPQAESKLAKQEFKTYHQRSTEDISTYLSTKRALYDVAYPHGTGNFDNLLDEIIAGIYNKEVKLQLLRSNPRNAQEMELNAVQIVANERAAFENGYSRSETKDGLHHTTQSGVRPTEEPMDISALKDEIRTLKEDINAMSMDKSKISCYGCGKKGHIRSECRSSGGFRGRGGFVGRNQNQSGGKFAYTCHHCGKVGHKRADCRTLKREQQNAGQRGRGGQFNRNVKDMRGQDETDGEPSGYSHFLEQGSGEIEEN